MNEQNSDENFSLDGEGEGSSTIYGKTRKMKAKGHNLRNNI